MVTVEATAQMKITKIISKPNQGKISWDKNVA